MMQIKDDLIHYFEQLAKYSILSKEEEQFYAFKKEQGDKEAREKLIGSCFRWAIKIASLHKGKGIPYEDLVSEAIAGLIDAVDRYVPGRARLATYATYYIRLYVYKAFQRSTVIRVPDVYGDRKDQDAFTRNIERARSCISGNHKFEDTIYEDSSFEGVERKYDQALLLAKVKEIVKTLPQRKRDIFKLRFEEQKTLESIGKKYSFSRERARQYIKEIKEELIQKMNGSLDDYDF